MAPISTLVSLDGFKQACLQKSKRNKIHFTKGIISVELISHTRRNRNEQQRRRREKNAQRHIINQTTYKIWIFYTFLCSIRWCCLFLFLNAFIASPPSFARPARRSPTILFSLVSFHFDSIAPRYCLPAVLGADVMILIYSSTSRWQVFFSGAFSQLG